MRTTWESDLEKREQTCLHSGSLLFSFHPTDLILLNPIVDGTTMHAPASASGTCFPAVLERFLRFDFG